MYKKAGNSSSNSLTNIRYPATGNQQPDSGFTLIEILIAIFIFAIIVTTIFGSYNSVFTGVEVINQSVLTLSRSICLCLPNILLRILTVRRTLIESSETPIMFKMSPSPNSGLLQLHIYPSGEK
ncbi:MAG: prepilin-type N-terminal cleavage/methylation domain-containing protein [Deltaproteobacteria bacterium]|nr:prepilin-type N-terminal cleavage/methylation domain-containing protein [Deltaproteobacteria bacterium]